MGSSISALLLAQLLLGPASAAIVDLSALESDTAAESVTRRVLFKLDATRPQLAHDDEGRRAQRAVAVGASLGCAGTKRLFRHAGKHEVDQLAAGLHLWFAAQCDTEALAVAAMKSFAGTASEAADDVAYMEPELKPSASIQSNDPELTNQPHYGAMNLFQAWNLERGSPSVVVQVLDTGIDLEHEDFQNNIWRNELEICGNGIDDDDNGYVDDCHGYNHADDTGGDLQGDGWHGSHTAGTIAADTDNGVGVAGVAGGTSDSPGVKLMISVGFGTTSTGGFAEALIYGANNGARISSNSWGYTLPGPLPQTEKAAIDYYNSKNGIVVFAAGNDGSDDEYNPGAYEGVVGVAAVDNSGVAASFTNYGAWIDIAAPGVSVLSTTTKDEYGYASGTSMACPHVAGVFALGWSADPAASKEKLLGCAYSTARDVDSLNAAKYQGGALGAGFMDAEAFVACVILLAPSAAPTASPAPTTTRPTLQPSISPAPTEGCGPCDQELKLTLKTDNYPAETSWKLSHVSAGSPCTIDDVTGGDYTEPAMDYSYTFSATICAGEDYTFTVEDTYSDGMCCAYGEGGYELKLEGVLVASGGEFGGQDSTTFTVPDRIPTVPTAMPTLKPTLPPTALPTPGPTTLPTTAPTTAPTLEPNPNPTLAPTMPPTREPTVPPTTTPTLKPAPNPTLAPTVPPTREPTLKPTPNPTLAPTVPPTREPTAAPTLGPTTASATRAPTTEPTPNPTLAPTAAPTPGPTTASPTRVPTTSRPSLAPTAQPSLRGSAAPTSVGDAAPAWARRYQEAILAKFNEVLDALGRSESSAKAAGSP